MRRSSTASSMERLTPPRTTARFATTHWSVVLQAGQDEAGPAAEALERLCRTYWYPVYAHVRRQGHGPEDSEDLTQGFFAHLVGRDFLGKVAPEKGRFRSFLLACLNHFLSDDWDRARAAKRGRGQPAISLDAGMAEALYRQEPTDGLTPAIDYDRHWLASLLGRAQARLAGEYAVHGKTGLLHGLLEFPLAERGESSFRDCAIRLGLSESALKSAVHRMRRRYRELVREEVAHTVKDPAEVEAEIRHLIATLNE